MLEKFLKQTAFTSYDDFMQHFKVQVPDNFNFGYDVIDGWAAEAPNKQAILWTNEAG
jgi:acetyl-CoA synthetase